MRKARKNVMNRIFRTSTRPGESNNCKSVFHPILMKFVSGTNPADWFSQLIFLFYKYDADYQRYDLFFSSDNDKDSEIQ